MKKIVLKGNLTEIINQLKELQKTKKYVMEI